MWTIAISHWKNCLFHAKLHSWRFFASLLCIHPSLICRSASLNPGLRPPCPACLHSFPFQQTCSLFLSIFFVNSSFSKKDIFYFVPYLFQHKLVAGKEIKYINICILGTGNCAVWVLNQWCIDSNDKNKIVFIIGNKKKTLIEHSNNLKMMLKNIYTQNLILKTRHCSGINVEQNYLRYRGLDKSIGSSWKFKNKSITGNWCVSSE